MTNKGSASHSAWLTFMYPRLSLAHNLLTDDGVIFISIDDNEQANLKLLCDDIFGEENFIADIIWEKRYTRNNDAKLISSLYDHTLFYRKSGTLEKLRESRTEKTNSIYSNPDNDPRGDWTSVSYISQRTKEQRPNLSYQILNPITGNFIHHPVNAWKYSKEQNEFHTKDNRLYWGKKGENQYPRLKRFLNELNEGIVPVNIWNYKDTGTIDDGTKIVDLLLGKDIFDYPKPPSLIRRMLDMTSKDDSIILDFFSGSATTAHAVMQLNAKDNGNRKYIMVQLPEVCKEDSEAFKAGYKTINHIGIERITRAAKKIKDETGSDIDFGFKCYDLVTPNQNTLDKLTSFDKAKFLTDKTVLDGFGKATVINTWAVADGYGFSSDVKEINLSGYIAYHCGNHLYLLDENISAEAINALVEKYENEGNFNPNHIVLFGYSFIWSNKEMLQSNIKQIKYGAKELNITISTRY